MHFLYILENVLLIIKTSCYSEIVILGVVINKTCYKTGLDRTRDFTVL